MKILLAGYYDGKIPLTPQCADALKSLGHSVICFDSGENVSYLLGTFMRHCRSIAKRFGKEKEVGAFFKRKIEKSRQIRLINANKSYQPDVNLIISLHTYEKATISYLREHSKVICWMVEPLRAESIQDDIRIYDHYYSMHSEHVEQGAIYLPVFAHDPGRYFFNSSVPKDFLLLFIGAWSLRRQKWLEILHDFSDQLAIIGPQWKKKLSTHHPLRRSVKGKYVCGNDLTKWYQRARIVMNINRHDMKELKLSGANLRVAEVPACGTALLTEYTPDLENFFEIGNEIEVFQNPEEMRAKILELTKNNEKLKRLTENGKNAVQRIGTFKDRMNRILENIA